jgi:hypothetical protein
MKKILATLAGTVALALGAGACSAVDTQETKSIAPIAAPATSVVTPPVLNKNFSRFDYYGKPSRSENRPVKPTVKPVKPVSKPAAKPVKKKVKLVKVYKKVYKKTVKPKKKYKKKVTTSTKKHRAPGGIAACIRKYESGGNYRAQNPTSTASGAYQFINSTWRAITGRSDRAKDAPPSVQDAAFWKLWDGGRGASHWVTAKFCL